MLKFAGIIPARYASTRFPGKPLVKINGKTMIHRVYLQATKVLEHICVATDDARIEEEVKRFGGRVVMTSPNHQSGTDRCAEAAANLQKELGVNFDVIINIQGDEPFIQPEQLRKLMSCFDNPETQIATLVKPLHNIDDILNPNHVKVVLNKDNRAMYFSRSPIPYIRGKETASWADCHQYFKHLGIYAYRTEVLNEVTRLSQSSLELAESLEQLRWLENGLCIAVEKTDFESVAIDTPEDLEKLKGIEFAD
jgi:3-deoxy-D-manno-octulosonate cytidylyltransferase